MASFDINNPYPTGEICDTTGYYACEMHIYIEILLNEGDIFPRCEKSHNTNWLMKFD